MDTNSHSDLYYNIITEFLSRDRLAEDLILKICEYMLEGNFVIRYGHVPETFNYEERLKFTPETINWDMEYNNNTNLCQLYLHSLEPVKYLILGYEIAENESYLALASDVIKSWLDYSDSTYDNKFPWYDHCVSDRTLYLIYFIEMIKKHNIEGYGNQIEIIQSLLKKQALFLFNDENYTSQNHGTMMDRSLYLLSKYSNDGHTKEWRNKALTRLRTAFKRDFSENMVNLENSSEYHLFNFDLFVVIEKSLLNRFGDSLGDDFQEVINKGVDYMIHLAKPDLNFPQIGDGSKSSIASIKNHPCFKYIHHHERLKFILSSGNQGTPPTELVKVYSVEGYAFMRNSWDFANNKNNISYASFIAGYSLKNHKHGDDLSFTYYAKNRDIFVDCGTFTYQAGDFRRHFMSALSHNTVIVNGMTYPFIEGDPQNTGLLNYGEEDEYNYVIGKNDMYQGVNLTRSLYFLKSGNIIIVDDIYSNKLQTYSQLFHMSHRLNTNKIMIDKNTVQVIEKDITITIKQLGETSLLIHRGDKTIAGIGLVSERFNSLHESSSLEFQIKGRSTRFITLISVSENDDTVPTFNAFLTTNSLNVKDGEVNFSIPLNTFNRTIEEGVFLEEEKINDYSYKFTIVGAKPNVEYAWYVMRNGERLDIIWYTDNPQLEYTFTESGLYEIHYFIRHKINQDDKVRFIYENKIKVQ